MSGLRRGLAGQDRTGPREGSEGRPLPGGQVAVEVEAVQAALHSEGHQEQVEEMIEWCHLSVFGVAAIYVLAIRAITM